MKPIRHPLRWTFRAGLLATTLLLSACATLWAQGPRPDTDSLSENDCKPCHLATVPVVGGTWDAQALYPEVPLKQMRSSGNQGGEWIPGHADKIPVDMTLRGWEVWQELLPKKHKRKGKTCFDCHLQNSPKPLAELKGFRLPADTQATPQMLELHRWLGTSKGWHSGSVGLWVDVDTYKTFLVATVKVLNYGGGHRLPASGEGGEHMVLEVTAVDGKGRPLEFARGHTLPSFVGEPWAEAPGYLYAQVFADAEGKPVADPASASSVLMDTRLLGDEHDELHFYFLLPKTAEEGKLAWRVQTRLLWRPSLKAGAQELRVMKEASREL